MTGGHYTNQWSARMLRQREEYREELRNAIVHSARDLFVRQGFESFSMRKLAKKLGCSHGNIYVYFKDKQQLFDAVVEDSFAQLACALRDLQGQHPNDPVRMLKEAGRIYVNFGRQNPHAYEFAFILRRTGPARPWKPHSAFAFLRNTIKACIDDGLFRPLGVDTATQAVWAAVHGVTSLLIARPTFPWVPSEQLIERVIDSAVDSLLSTKGSKNMRRNVKAMRARRAS
jgi:AcrR family transcriptional regulator